MPFPVSKLIQGRGQPTSVQEKDPASHALKLMFEKDYSQLPVVNAGNIPLGMITHESILRAMKNFGVSLDSLRVSNAMVNAPTFNYEDDLFDMLERLKAINAVLIVDAAGGLDGIVTSYDTTEFFRRRAEDIMRIEDIEGMVRDFIKARYTNPDEHLDEQTLQSAVNRIASGDQERKNRVKKTMKLYLDEQNLGDLDEALIIQCYDATAPQREPRLFSDLSLSEYIALLIDRNSWDFYQPIFDLDSKALFTILDQVRQIRNFLAHFHGELTAEQRQQVIFCAEWLGRCQEQFEEMVEHQKTFSVEPSTITGTETVPGEIVPVDGTILPGDSRYGLLAGWLQNQTTGRVQLTFNQIEEIIGGELPASAYTSRSWWANDPVENLHSLQWLDAGWRVTYRNVAGRTITFARMIEREKLYMDFFNALLPEFKKVTATPVKDVSPAGDHYMLVRGLPFEGTQLATINFSFYLHHRFGVTLYIDGRNYAFNKAVFDELYRQKEVIEYALGAELVWARMVDKRACLITYQIPGIITDSASKLKEIRTWAVGAMERFQQVIVEPANLALLKYKNLLDIGN